MFFIPQNVDDGFGWWHVGLPVQSRRPTPTVAKPSEIGPRVTDGAQFLRSRMEGVTVDSANRPPSRYALRWTSFAQRELGADGLKWLAIRSSPKASEGWWTRCSPVGTRSPVG